LTQIGYIAKAKHAVISKVKVIDEKQAIGLYIPLI
jgi:hypothetical protein